MNSRNRKALEVRAMEEQRKGSSRDHAQTTGFALDAGDILANAIDNNPFLSFDEIISGLAKQYPEMFGHLSSAETVAGEGSRDDH